MRITQKEQTIIRTFIQEILPHSEVYIFGSRTDDSQRGGDIDILVIGDRIITVREKIQVKSALYRRIGEQKIDIVSFKKNDDAPFKTLALSNALSL